MVQLFQNFNNIKLTHIIFYLFYLLVLIDICILYYINRKDNTINSNNKIKKKHSMFNFDKLYYFNSIFYSLYNEIRHEIRMYVSKKKNKHTIHANNEVSYISASIGLITIWMYFIIISMWFIISDCL